MNRYIIFMAFFFGIVQCQGMEDRTSNTIEQLVKNLQPEASLEPIKSTQQFSWQVKTRSWADSFRTINKETARSVLGLSGCTLAVCIGLSKRYHKNCVTRSLVLLMIVVGGVERLIKLHYKKNLKSLHQ